MVITDKNIDAFRSLSKIFTSSNFDKVIRNNDLKYTKAKIKKYTSAENSGLTYKNVLKKIYAELQNEYCGEYFFKNTLLNQYLLKEYKLKTTTVLNEFKIKSSIADFVLLNGSARVYEIKTDLDNLDKLNKQLQDYCEFADKVYVVTTSKYINRILESYVNTTIGVIEFTKDKKFKEHKPARYNNDHFDHETIFKTLRKSEYLRVINDYFGYVPDVPNTQIFRSCLNLARMINVSEFQKMAFTILKKRKIQCPELFKSQATPYELKQICYSLDFSTFEYKLLYEFLHKPI